MQVKLHMLGAAMRRPRILKEGAEAVLKLCGSPSGAKGLPFGTGRSGRAVGGVGKGNPRDGKGVKNFHH